MKYIFLFAKNSRISIGLTFENFYHEHAAQQRHTSRLIPTRAFTRVHTHTTSELTSEKRYQQQAAQQQQRAASPASQK